MSKRYKFSTKNIGTSPGTLQYIGKTLKTNINIEAISYNQAEYQITTVIDIENIVAKVPKDKVLWVNVDGIHEPETIGAIGKAFGLHTLLLEDLMNTEQKPKIEHFGTNLLFVSLKMLSYNHHNQEVESQQVGLVLHENCLLSFQEELDSDIFENIKERIKASVGKTRTNAVDYLLYALIDMVVDNYFVVLDSLGEKLETLEENIIAQARNSQVAELYKLKRELTLVRKAILPIREIMQQLSRNEIGVIQPSTQIYLRDVYDHINQIIENIDSFRELIASLLDLYMSSISNRLNDVMKILTIISVIFLPLNLVVGFYGMNFQNMPELKWEHGERYIFGLMLGVVAFMLIYFKRKKWL